MPSQISHNSSRTPNRTTEANKLTIIISVKWLVIADPPVRILCGNSWDLPAEPVPHSLLESATTVRARREAFFRKCKLHSVYILRHKRLHGNSVIPPINTFKDPIPKAAIPDSIVKLPQESTCSQPDGHSPPPCHSQPVTASFRACRGICFSPPPISHS